ncbi:MAG: hypothetical protein QOE68_3795 [Thermoanaerobaculia bacterium]|jgi:hypothetical protein|nr:hypothetical protein [Thermoanaerobaculia bacterium]
MSGFLESFLGTLAAGGVLVVALRFLGGKLIEHQLAKALSDHNHELAKQLATLQGGMSRLGDVLSRRNEREFEVVEGAWKRMANTFRRTVQEVKSEQFSPSVGEVKSSWCDYRDYLNDYEIFFSNDIYAAFSEIQINLLEGVIRDIESAKQKQLKRLEREQDVKADEAFASIGNKRDALAKVIRARFGFHERSN